MAKIHTIMLVEDHPLMRRVIRELLEREPSLRVEAEVESVESALVQLKGSAPDLVLTDMSLPGASGLELVQTLKQERPELRCLVVMGHVGEFYRRAALTAGAAGFVTKDDPDEVLRAVKKVLSMSGFSV